MVTEHLTGERRTKKILQGPRYHLLVDSGFFFALFNPGDSRHSEALQKQELLDTLSVVIPWPILYETVNTKFAKTMSRSSEWLRQFKKICSKSKLLDDSPYRLSAFEKTLQQSEARQPISLVDSVMLLMLEDKNIRIGAILTFNDRDFTNICYSKGIKQL